jgi:hypothetical protein
MTMKKLALLIGVIAVHSLGACGGDEPAKDPSGVAPAAPPPSAAPAPIETAAPPATASAAPTPPPPPPVVEAPALAIEGLKITGKGRNGKPLAVEVKADGTVVRDGKTTIGAFAKNELKDEKGGTLYAVGADGKVTIISGPATTAAFNAKDELQVEGVPTPLISVGDDGTVTAVGAKPEKAPYKFDKLPAKSKRAAVLLTMLLDAIDLKASVEALRAKQAAGATKPTGTAPKK